VCSCTDLIHEGVAAAAAVGSGLAGLELLKKIGRGERRRRRRRRRRSCFHFFLFLCVFISWVVEEEERRERRGESGRGIALTLDRRGGGGKVRC
jgi:hypothetical protein